MTALDPDARSSALKDLPGWKYDLAYDALFRELTFSNFDAAFAFMTRVALTASRLDHHPEWSNVYNRVTIRLRTHDCHGISARDLELAAEINTILAASAPTQS